MVRLRLRRVGAKKQPSYRVVAADKESPRDGRFIENLGFYNPRTEPETIQLNEERIYDWMNNGAQMSNAIEKVFKSAGLLERYERFKGGESLDDLMEEAKAAEAVRNIDPKTQRQAPEKTGKKKKAELKENELKAEKQVESKPEEKVEIEERQEQVEDAPQEANKQEPELELEPVEKVDEEPGEETQPEGETEAESELEPEGSPSPADDEVGTEESPEEDSGEVEPQEDAKDESEESPETEDAAVGDESDKNK